MADSLKLETLELKINSEQAMIELGGAIARALEPPVTIYLVGDLGAGKTTFCRGVLVGLGHQGAVKSPTYTVVESYPLSGVHVHHFDLYRLADPEELEFIGIRDYFSDDAICLIEWPARGQGIIMPPDVVIELSLTTPGGRHLSILSKSHKGNVLLEAIKI